MNLKVLITSIAAAVCVLAVSSARAQSAVTNSATLSFLQYLEANPTTNGSTITYKVVKEPHTSAQLIQDELAPLITNITHVAISSAAKLVLLTGNNGATFGIVDGANFYDLSTNGYGVMTFDFPGGNNVKVKSGTESDITTQKNTTQTQVIKITFDDTGIGGGLTFSLQGVATITETATAVVSGTYTDTVKAKATLAGNGYQSGFPFVVTSTMSISGSGKLSPVP
jgi:hypothetical protein